MLSQRELNSIYAGLGIIILAVITIWWMNNFELVETQVRDSMSIQARRNDFLAAEMFLGTMGADVESVSGRSVLHDLPSTDDVLVINHFDGSFSDERFNVFLDWILAGGHVVISTDQFWDEERGLSGNALLDFFGIQLIRNSQIPDDQDVPSVLVEVEFENGESARVAFNSRAYFEDSYEYAEVSSSSEYGPQLPLVVGRHSDMFQDITPGNIQRGVFWSKLITC